MPKVFSVVVLAHLNRRNISQSTPAHSATLGRAAQAWGDSRIATSVAVLSEGM